MNLSIVFLIVAIFISGLVVHQSINLMRSSKELEINAIQHFENTCVWAKNRNAQLTRECQKFFEGKDSKDILLGKYD